MSLMSELGVSTVEIAWLVGQNSTRVTETVYQRELRPAITAGAEVMDAVCQLPRTDQCPGCWKCRLGSGRSQGEERC